VNRKVSQTADINLQVIESGQQTTTGIHLPLSAAAAAGDLAVVVPAICDHQWSLFNHFLAPVEEMVINRLRRDVHTFSADNACTISPSRAESAVKFQSNVQHHNHFATVKGKDATVDMTIDVAAHLTVI